jgi:hypothetical protein
MKGTSVLLVVGCLPPAPKMNRLRARLIHTINGTEVIGIHNVSSNNSLSIRDEPMCNQLVICLQVMHRIFGS